MEKDLEQRRLTVLNALECALKLENPQQRIVINIIDSIRKGYICSFDEQIKDTTLNNNYNFIVQEMDYYYYELNKLLNKYTYGTN